MLVTDATTGALVFWNGGGWQHFTPANAPHGQGLVHNGQYRPNFNPEPGILLTWDGINWVNSSRRYSISR